MLPPVLEFVPQIRYTTEQAAQMLAVSVSWLQKKRIEGGGPKYQQESKTSIFYTYDDLKAWSDSLPTFSNHGEYLEHKRTNIKAA